MDIGFIIIPFILLAAIFLVIIGRAYWFFVNLQKKGLKTQGEITDYEEYSNSKGKKTFFPIIKFKTHLGQEIHKRTLYGFGVSHYIEKGSKVEVIYSEKTPRRFMLGHYNPFKINIIILSGFIFCISMAIVFFLLSYNNPHWIQEFIDSFK